MPRPKTTIARDVLAALDEHRQAQADAAAPTEQGHAPHTDGTAVAAVQRMFNARASLNALLDEFGTA